MEAGRESAMITLFDNADSGNGYKIRLLFALLNIAHDRVEIDTYAGESRTAAYLARNPNGRIPLVELDDGSHLAESGAILHHFAVGTTYWPAALRDQSEALQWMFFEQYSHEPYIAVLRSWSRHGEMTEDRKAQWSWREGQGYSALDIMATHLSGRDWFAGDGVSIADIALFAYTHVAGDGGFDLDRYPAVRAWIERLEQLPGFIGFHDIR